METTTATPYDPTRQYRVELAERTDVLGQTLYPGQDLTLRGDVLARLEPGKIASATLVSATVVNEGEV